MTDEARLSQAGRRLEREQLRRLELLSLAEATTLLLLIGLAAPLKHVFHWPLASKILGPVHGVVFLAYGWTALQTVAGGGWRRGEVVRLFAVAFLPFGGFWNVPWLRRRAQALDDVSEG